MTMDTCHHTFVNPNVDNELWVIQCGVVGSSFVMKESLWWGMLIVGAAAYVSGHGGMWEISVHAAQFHCEPVTVLKCSLKKHNTIYRWCIIELYA